MSSGMNMEEAKKIADKMTYREAIMNCLYARCVPYRKATKIKMKRLLERIEAPYVDLDTPMHFTQEQKAWVKKYISINGERQRLDGINDCLEIVQKIKDEHNDSNFVYPINYGTLCGIIIEIERLKENKNVRL